MRKLPPEKRAMVVATLCEGVSVRATARLCGLSKLTVLRLLGDLGSLCRDYHDLAVRGLRCRRVQCDEIWSFVGCKQRSREAGKHGHGNAWTWVGMDAESKIVLSYLIGARDAACARTFMNDLGGRIVTRVQLTTDGHHVYLAAVEGALGLGDVDYAMLVNLYGPEPTGNGPGRKYSPGKCNGARKIGQIGLPDPKHVSTSYVERQNLSLRMGNRPHTCLSNAFSRKLAYPARAIELHYFHYNFIRRHQTLGTTPAVAAGVADRQWTVADLVRMLEDEERKLCRGGRINRSDRT